jgi:hypothetical protein
LLDAQTLGCTGQMQFFRNCDEVTQQSEIQGHLLFVFFWFGLSGASISIRIPSAPPSMASLEALMPVWNSPVADMRGAGRRTARAEC